MKSLLCFGEALIDFLHTDFADVDGLKLANFRQFPGGAPANVAVAFARLGGEARFAGQVGGDIFGRFLEDALAHYGVNTQFLHKHSAAKTALAFVSLDSDGDRSFSFYRDRTADLLFSLDQVDDDWFINHPVFHVCSNTLTNAEIATVTMHALDRAARAGSLISFDANLRPSLWPAGVVDRSRCDAVVRSSDFIKFAREEIEFMADGDTDRYLADLLAGKPRLVVVTDGANPVVFFTAEYRGRVEIPNVDVVDTTAAGDAFTAAILRGLCAASDLEHIVGNVKCVRSLVEFAARCGSLTTTRAGAFPALPEFAEVEEYWNDMP
ncbi:MAG: carbohydrate kinase family protein [Woeseiaceae bacterium]